MATIKMTRAEYEAKYGSAPSKTSSSTNTPLRMTHDEYMAKYGGINTKTQETIQEEPSALKSFSTGVAKELLGTVKGLGKIGADIGNLPLKLFGMETKNPYSEEELQKSADKGGFAGKLLREENLEGKNLAENIGKGTAAIAEFFLPTSGVTKAQKAVDILVDGTKLPSFLKTASKIIGKGAIEGTSAGLVSTAQTGDIGQGSETGLIAGGLSTGLGTAGKILEKIKIPEKAYSQIFKSTSDDAIKSLSDEINAGLKTSDPERYNELVKIGMINNKTGAVNKTLAQEAIDKGLRGSIDNMAKQTIQNTYDLELAARNAVKGKTIKISGAKKDNLASLLSEVATDWRNIADGKISKEANKFSKLVSKGILSGEDTLSLRRFLDGMRINSSFNPNTKISQGQTNYKYFADLLRGQLSKLPGMKSIMNDYRFNIEALESLGKEAAKRNNRSILSGIDTLLLTGGIFTGAPTVSAAAAIGRNALYNPTVLTNIGQATKNLGKLQPTTAGVTTRATLGGGLSELINQ